MIRFKIMLLGLLAQQAFCGSCDFRIKGGRLLTNQKNFQLRITFNQACSKNAAYRRSLSSPSLELYQNNILISKMDFSKGMWLEQAGKFYLTGQKASRCSVGGLTLDLEKDYITSRQGAYLNLESADLKRWPCRKSK